MSPTKRPSAVDSLRRAVGPAPATAPASAPEKTPAQSKPVRVTLNIPPELYRQLRKWTDSAADAIGVPQVSQQDALRAMLTAVTLDKSIGLVVIDLLRRQH
jgi:hypothetical protein